MYQGICVYQGILNTLASYVISHPFWTRKSEVPLNPCANVNNAFITVDSDKTIKPNCGLGLIIENQRQLGRYHLILYIIFVKE